jgi:hypothetical protein
MTQEGHTVFFVEFMNRHGNRPSKKKREIIGRTKAGHKWAGNVTCWAEENTVDKDIKQIETKQPEHNGKCVEMISGLNITEFTRNPFESLNDSVHYEIVRQLMMKVIDCRGVSRHSDALIVIGATEENLTVRADCIIATNQQAVQRHGRKKFKYRN